MYPSSLSVTTNGNPVFPKYYEERLVTHRLAKDGYDCGLVGKLHLASAFGSQEARVDDGYRYFQYSHSHKGPNYAGHDYADWMRAQGVDPNGVLRDEAPTGDVRIPTEENDNVPPHLHQTFWCTEKSIEFIDKNREEGQPWLLSINPFDPHPPYDSPYEYYRRYDPESLPGAHFQDQDLDLQEKLADAGIEFGSTPQHPREWNDKEMQASYYGMIEQIDHEFGRLLDYLDSSGQRENTIVIFTSDHGEACGDHGLILKGCRFYEGLIRVPLMISWPGHFQSDVVSDELVELMDLTPTLYDLIGMEIPNYVQGRSLIPVLKGEADQHREFVRCEYHGGVDGPDQTHATMYRDRRWKLICYHGKGGLCELYDLENDPWEHQDLSGNAEYRDVKWELIQKSMDAAVCAYARGPERVAGY